MDTKFWNEKIIPDGLWDAFLKKGATEAMRDAIKNGDYSLVTYAAQVQWLEQNGISLNQAKILQKSEVKKPLSPLEFKALVIGKGWSYRAVAHRWGCHESYVGKIARDPNRSIHFEDAVRGLPVFDEGE